MMTEATISRRGPMWRTSMALICMLASLLPSAPLSAADSDQTIYAVVNDEPISAFDVTQRVKLLRMQGSGGGGVSKEAAAKFTAEMKKRQASMKERFLKYAIEQDPTLKTRQPSKDEVKALQDKFVAREKAYVQSLREKLAGGDVAPGMRDKALASLIGDRLKLQEARRLDLLVDNAELDDYVADLAKRNERTVKEFGQMLASQGIALGHFREQLRAQIAWRRVVARRFRGQVAVGQSEIDSALTVSAPAAGAETGTVSQPEIVELQLQRISVPLSGKIDQSVMAARYEQAEGARNRIKGCSDIAAAAKLIEGARHENLGRKSIDDLPETARPMLANAEKGDVTPPILTGSGIEIYAVCDKAVGKASVTARDTARSKLENQKLAALSKGLLSDLCSQAFIEYRNGIKATRACGAE